MLDADEEALPKYGGRAGRRARLRRQLAMSARHLLPKVLWTYSPWYTRQARSISTVTPRGPKFGAA
jgi:hypothetical protein